MLAKDCPHKGGLNRCQKCGAEWVCPAGNRYYLGAWLGGELTEREVTVEEFCKAERLAGFRPKLPSTDRFYMTTPATGGFSAGANTVFGRVAAGVKECATSSYEGPRKFTPEEIADGNKGIRWVTETCVAGRPTLHDVLDYIERRGDAIACTCDRCKAFTAAGVALLNEPQRWHDLKTDPAVFDAVASGAKTHEIRKNDRDFKVGDGLLLRRTKWTGALMKAQGYPLEYTGEECRRVVSHVLEGYGLTPGWCILSFAPGYGVRVLGSKETPSADTDG